MELSLREYFEPSLHTLLYSLTVFLSLDLKNKQTRNNVKRQGKIVELRKYETLYRAYVPSGPLKHIWYVHSTTDEKTKLGEMQRSTNQARCNPIIICKL